MTKRYEETSNEETAITFLSMSPDGSMSPEGFSGRESGTGRVATALKAAKGPSRSRPGRPRQARAG